MGVADPKRRRVKCRRKAEHDPVPGSPELASGTAARVPLTWRGGPVPSGPAEWRKRMAEQSPQQRSRQGCAFRACKARPRRKALAMPPSLPELRRSWEWVQLTWSEANPQLQQTTHLVLLGKASCLSQTDGDREDRGLPPAGPSEQPEWPGQVRTAAGSQKLPGSLSPCAAGSQRLGPRPAAFPGVTVGSWVASRATGIGQGLGDGIPASRAAA